MTRIVQSNPSNKFGAVKTLYGGRVYHSKRESEYARELDLRVMAKDILGWIPQVPIRLDINGTHICTYVMDFSVTHLDGRIELVEVKGAETAIWRLKVKLLKALYLPEHPEMYYTVVK